MADMPDVGDAAPDFELPSTQGQLRLSDITARQKVVLAFYSEDRTPLCGSQLSIFKEDYDLVRDLKAEVIAISVDPMDSHVDFAERLEGLPFPLVSDERREAARAYGVLDEDGKRSARAVFVIDKGGEILHAEPWFQPGNPAQYEEIFAALGLDI